MPVYTKQWDDPKEAGDGTRILVCRYRPRGLRKEDETWDGWMPELGPSVELHAAAYGKKREQIPWASYHIAYLREMRSQTAVIDALAKRIAEGETITFLCSSACNRESRCHRSLLKELIDKRIAAGGCAGSRIASDPIAKQGLTGEEA
jgi:uncharacterized protein YeaO (DUF488 family)